MKYDMTFLVVDDMEGMRRILTNSLHQIGVKNVFTANNGAEAWRRMQSQKFDVIISDWNMPVMSGLELLKTIRGTPAFANLPVLMMTAETERHQVQVAIESGVSEYLIKPFNTGALEAKIKRVLDQPRPSALAETTDVPAISRPKRGQANRPTALTFIPSEGESTSKPTILVVDDAPANLQLLLELLGEEFNYQVKVANSGARALKILEGSTLPDLILLDVVMPEMDGFEVCRRIKANPATADIPVIFLTAMTEATDVTKGFDVGAVDFVTKPAEPPILRARIETHLKLRRSFAELKRNRVALIEKNAVLEDHLRLRDDVDRITQHDLRNPIAGIISFAASLLGEQQLDDQYKDIIRYIEQSAYSVLNMVSLTLDLYKMEQGTYEFQPSTVDLAPLFNHIVMEKQSELATRNLSVQFSIRDITFTTPKPMPVTGDELLCYSMLSNLFRNALESAPSGTAIQVDMRVTGDAAVLQIRNSGTVPHDIRSTFFDKFTTSGKPGGTGLGTYSARLMAQIQGGQLSMDTSDETQTTTLTVTLPSVPPDSAD